MPTGIYKRTKAHGKAISKARKGHFVSEETKQKIGLANRGIWIKFNCDYCGKENEEKESHYNKKKRHFCNYRCYAKFVTEKLNYWETNAYKGIRKKNESKQIYHRNYCKNHPQNIAHLKARRYAKEQGAEGSHTLEEWNLLKSKFNYKCAKCGQKKPLTKDHIIPLSEGGTDFIDNIQPLCKSCNSKKWKFIDFNIYENPGLLKKEK